MNRWVARNYASKILLKSMLATTQKYQISNRSLILSKSISLSNRRVKIWWGKNVRRLWAAQHSNVSLSVPFCSRLSLLLLSSFTYSYAFGGFLGNKKSSLERDFLIGSPERHFMEELKQYMTEGMMMMKPFSRTAVVIKLITFAFIIIIVNIW